MRPRIRQSIPPRPDSPASRRTPLCTALQVPDTGCQATVPNRRADVNRLGRQLDALPGVQGITTEYVNDPNGDVVLFSIHADDAAAVVARRVRVSGEPRRRQVDQFIAMVKLRGSGADRDRHDHACLAGAGASQLYGRADHPVGLSGSGPTVSESHAACTVGK